MVAIFIQYIDGIFIWKLVFKLLILLFCRTCQLARLYFTQSNNNYSTLFHSSASFTSLDQKKAPHTFKSCDWSYACSLLT